jgi:hypothetical protein
MSMTLTTTKLIDDLHEQVAGLAPERRQRLIAELKAMSDIEANAGDEHEHDDPRQLPLFGFRTLVESDDELKTATLETIAKAYGISAESLKRYIRTGALSATRFGRRYHVTVAELKRFLATPRTTKRGPKPGTKATTTTTAKE